MRSKIGNADKSVKKQVPPYTSKNEHFDLKDCSSLGSKTQPSSGDESYTHDSKSREMPKLKRILEISTLIVGLCAVCVYMGQWDQAAKANKLATKNFQMNQRAWLGTDENSSITVTPNAPIRWDLEFRNFGNSPALHVRLHTHLYPDKDYRDFASIGNAINFLSLDTFQATDAIVFNGQVIHDAADSLNITTPAEAEVIRSHASPVIIGGKVSYEDIFGKRHFYWFCRVYDAPKILGKDGLTPCPGVPDESTDEK